METERARKAIRIFQEAAELEGEERGIFLGEECADDTALRAKVEAMLAAHDDEDEFLEHPPGMEEIPDLDIDRLVGKRIEQYRLERIISSGGMGTVYEAVQENPRRTVALKVMRAGVTSRASLRRFEYEAQILGRLRHPGIAQIFEAGTHREEGGTGSVPYFAMEYIPEARPITEYAHDEGIVTTACLQLMAQVCDAVHHGHQKGIIHRDLKPSNILVDSSGQVKIIDFGVARATDSDLALTTLQTEVGQLLGTIQYMSPEQCEANPHDLDIRSDVYALGVVLYELLCSRLPYDVNELPLVEAVRRIREERPARPSTMVRKLRGDVETIVMKALEKDRERRYSSADELRRDLERYLRGEPILARPPTLSYRFRTFAARNKVLVGGVVTVFVALVAGVTTSTRMYLQAEAARAQAAEEAETARQVNAFFSAMLASLDPLQLGIGGANGLPDEPSPLSTTGYARDISVAEMMRWAIPRIDETFGGKPELEARVRETIGTTFSSLGLFDEARLQLEEALAIRRALLGESDESTLRAKVQLGNVLRWTGEFGRIEELLQPALADARAVYGEGHPITLNCATLLATALSFQGETAEGDGLFAETLASARSSAGIENRHTLWMMGEWAFDLGRRVSNAKAEPLASEAYEVSRRILGREDFITVFTEAELGCFLSYRGQFARAEELLRHALEARRRLSGDGHPRTGICKYLLSQALRGKDTLAERVSLARGALDGWRQALGEGHFYVGNACDVLDPLLVNHEMYGELEALRRERYELCRRELGEDAWQTREAVAKLALLLRKRGRPDEGVDLYRDRLRIRRDRFGDEHPRVLSALGELAVFALRCGKEEDGKAVCRNWVDQATRTLGDEHPVTVHARTAAAALLRAGQIEVVSESYRPALTGWRLRTGEAEATADDFNDCAWLLLTCEPVELRDARAALSLAETAVELGGGAHPAILDTLALAHEMTGDTGRALEIQTSAIAMLGTGDSSLRDDLNIQLARLLLNDGRTEQAEQVLDAMLAEHIEKMGEDSLNLVSVYFSQARMLTDAGRHDLAEPRARAYLEVCLRAAAGDPSWRVADARALLGQCLAGLGRYGEAEQLLIDGHAGLKDVPVARADDASRRARTGLVELYEAWGRPEDAAKYRSR